MRDRRWKVVALLAAGIAIGVVMVGTPAGAHVAGWTHNWNDGAWVTLGTWAVTAP